MKTPGIESMDQLRQRIRIARELAAEHSRTEPLQIWFTPWAIVESSNVHGILGPDLPDGSKPAPGLATGHSLIGMWVSK